MTFRRYVFWFAPLACVLSGLAPPLTAPAHAATARAAASGKQQALAEAIRNEAGGKIGRAYAERGYAPLWIADGRIGKDAQVLLRYIDDARADGQKPSRYKPGDLREAIAAAKGGDAQALARADVALTRAFVRYSQDLRKVRNVGMDYANKRLKPAKLADDAVLRVATRRNFSRYLANMGWMSPHYVRIRDMLADALERGGSERTIALLRRNLERARVLPSADVRHIVVDASSAQLWYYQDGERVGTMKVVVGTNETQTPLLAGYLNYAILNPYWNVPDYLVRDNIARKVLSGRSLDSMNMQALSDWSANPRVIDPATIDWQAVASGRRDLRVRELPGPANSMGKVKYIFPNDHGIYLHDTPNRALFGKPDRHFSNGCIRLERAGELGEWMLGRKATARGKAPEQAVPIPAPVPVYLTYLTPSAAKSGVTFRADVYGLDKDGG